MGLLDGVRIVELSRTLAGPFAGHVLADLGAEVIKIEQPGIGDESRSFAPPMYRGMSCYFQAVNRNKGSVVLDLKNSADLEKLYELVREADVVTESFRTGVAERVGVDYRTLADINPSLIYLSISGYGRTGSRAEWPAYDIVMQAETGLMSITGTADGELVKIGPSIADIATGLYGGIGILSALLERERSGLGQQIEVAMYDAQFAILNNWLLGVLSTGQAPGPMGQGNPSLAPYQIIQTRNAEYMIGCANDGLWRRFCEAVGLTELLSDSRFSSNSLRVQNRGELIELIEAQTSQLAAEDVDERLKAAGVPGSRVNNLLDVIRDPFMEERGILISLEDDSETKTVKFPVTFGRTPVTKYRAAPKLGRDHPQWEPSRVIDTKTEPGQE